MRKCLPFFISFGIAALIYPSGHRLGRDLFIFLRTLKMVTSQSIWDKCEIRNRKFWNLSKTISSYWKKKHLSFYISHLEYVAKSPQVPVGCCDFSCVGDWLFIFVSKAFSLFTCCCNKLERSRQDVLSNLELCFRSKNLSVCLEKIRSLDPENSFGIGLLMFFISILKI